MVNDDSPCLVIIALVFDAVVCTFGRPHEMLSARRLELRLPRELDPVEIRVLGCLLEKEQTTPGAYPLTLLLDRRPGQNEARWMHLVGGPPNEATLASVETETRGPSLAQRVTDLEDRLAQVEATLASLTTTDRT